jgi:ATP phosphoribosyltransferase
MKITIALSKGRIFEQTIPLLEGIGITCNEDPETSRKLILDTNQKDIKLIIVRATDVPTYVEYGAADIGITGKDILDEYMGEGLYQPIDLNIGRCKMMVAAKQDFDYAGAIQKGVRLKVATKYVKVANIDLIKLYGSMELAPLVGLADVIVDLVSTGKTLKANNLVAVEDISDISSRLIINQASLKLKRELLQPILSQFEKALKA